jgi:UDP-N-acetylmuramyl pentapeptide phosphotransferase/UDP-N-acetylglucosamine-1-phosphate transferase
MFARPFVLLSPFALPAWCAWWLWRGTDASVPLSPSALVAILAMTLTIAWSANLYNFMDGSDGLAATMTMIGFGAYGIAGSLSGEAGAAFLALRRSDPAVSGRQPPARDDVHG